MKTKTSYKQYFIVGSVALIIGVLFLCMSFPDIRAIAKENPAVNIFILGLTLLFISAGMFTSGLSTRSWMKQMDKQFKAQQSHSGDQLTPPDGE